MRQLSEILDSIRQNTKSQDQVTTKKQLEPAWEAVKDYVDSLPQDYAMLVKKNGIKGTESLFGKLTKTQFDLGNHKGMPLELVEYTKADGSVHSAWYALINNKKGVVYKRDL